MEDNKNYICMLNALCHIHLAVSEIYLPVTLGIHIYVLYTNSAAIRHAGYYPFWQQPTCSISLLSLAAAKSLMMVQGDPLQVKRLDPICRNTDYRGQGIQTTYFSVSMNTTLPLGTKLEYRGKG